MEFRVDVARVEEVPQFPCPVPLRLDMAGQEVLVRRRRQRERMVFGGLERGAVQPYPLAGQVFEIGRTVELDLEHVGRQQFGLEYVQRHVLGPQADHLVQDEHDAGADEVFPEFRRPGDPGQPVQQHQHVHGHVQTMGGPEVRVRLLPYDRMREREYDDHDDEQTYAGHACKTTGADPRNVKTARAFRIIVREAHGRRIGRLYSPGNDRSNDDVGPRRARTGGAKHRLRAVVVVVVGNPPYKLSITTGNDAPRRIIG